MGPVCVQAEQEVLQLRQQLEQEQTANRHEEQRVRPGVTHDNTLAAARMASSMLLQSNRTPGVTECCGPAAEDCRARI